MICLKSHVLCYNESMKNISILKIYKNGFTLAEVLITLVIIGVIAAMTIPTMINNLQKNELRSQFKKQVSVISQVIQKMKIDNGDIIYISDNDSVTDFRNRFIGYFSVICKNNCVDVSKYRNYINKNDDAIGYISSNSFITSDGASYAFHKGSSGNIYVTVDVNGPGKKPNRWGYDTFTFYIPVNSTSHVFQPCGIGKPADMKCNSTATSHNGAGCTEKALSDANYFKNLP